MRIIAHLDMDAFFASVEERNRPRLKGLPIAVGADPADGKGRGVVSTANYKAREYGIRSAMPISKAWQLSEVAKKQGKPAAVFLDGNFGSYKIVSGNILRIIRKYIPHIEQASVDEAYLDLSFTGSYSAAEELCRKIKKEIRDKEKLTCSIGVGPNKLIAKIAVDMHKPDGITVVGDDEEKKCAQLAEEFLEPLAIRKIPGIGPKSEEVFSKIRIKTVGDAKKLSQGDLYDLMGEWGLELYEKLRGRDNTPIVEEYEVKSIGEQETFSVDTKDFQLVNDRLKHLCGGVSQSFRKRSGFKSYKTIAVTVRFDDFETKTHAHTLVEPVSDEKTLYFEAMKLILPFLDKRENPKNKLIRLIGVRIEKLI